MSIAYGSAVTFVALVGALLAFSHPASAESSLSGTTFNWTAAGTCRILTGQAGLVVSGSPTKPQIFVTGTCPKPIPGYERYNATQLVSYAADRLGFTGYLGNGAKFLIYFGGWNGVGRTPMSAYVARYVKPPPGAKPLAGAKPPGAAKPPAGKGTKRPINPVWQPIY